MMRYGDEYHKLLDQALKEARRGDAGSDVRFVAALHSKGLRIKAEALCSADETEAFMAPSPYEDGYDYPSRVVWSGAGPAQPARPPK